MVAVRVAFIRLSSAHYPEACTDDKGALPRPRGVLAARMRWVLRRDVLRERERVRGCKDDDRGLRSAASQPLYAMLLHDRSDVAVVRASLGVRTRLDRRA